MKISTIDIKGEKSANLDLSDKIFSIKPNRKLVQQLLMWNISKIKPRLAKTKQRNAIKGSTAKIYAQKGTGGARHSSRKAPIFVGGGVAHGPKGAVYHVKKINKKIKKIGLINVLSSKAIDKKLLIVNDIKDKILKTKVFNSFLKKNKIEKVLIVADKSSKLNIQKSSQNIANVKLIDESATNVYDILNYEKLLFTQTSIKNLEKRLTNEK
tara:strand:- start:3 stop:635 length:633 start_codon:yes stop_codon:yes gene_type:complete